MHKVCQKTFCIVAKFMKFHLLPHTLLESYTYIVPNQIHPSYLKVADEEPWARQRSNKYFNITTSAVSTQLNVYQHSNGRRWVDLSKVWMGQIKLNLVALINVCMTDGSELGWFNQSTIDRSRLI